MEEMEEVEQRLAFLRNWLHKVEQCRREAVDEYSVSFLGEDKPVMREWEARVGFLSALSAFSANALLVFRLRSLPNEEEVEAHSPLPKDFTRVMRGILLFIGRENGSFEIVTPYIFLPPPFEEEAQKFFAVVFEQYGYQVSYGSMPEAAVKDAVNAQ